ncbi:hypothetical protein PVAP13_1NG110300 [Panicum virgatum]|uniref:Uncharacterized protein n=1 Tax=Panicum virgatum TaxID=38727 RepID=A0A8T0WK37_PANVG|nr:hypothetical protein PVAP13_1NG110300 [Panicum virgatum]
MPAGALLFRPVAPSPRTWESSLSPWLRSPTRQWDGSSSRRQSSEASPSKSTRDYAENVGDGASEAEEAFTQSPLPAGDKILCGARPAVNESPRVWLRPPARRTGLHRRGTI